MHYNSKLIYVSKKYHATTLTNDTARTMKVSTSAVMLGLSFANAIEKSFSCMMVLATLSLLGIQIIFSVMTIKCISYLKTKYFMFFFALMI